MGMRQACIISVGAAKGKRPLGKQCVQKGGYY